MSRYRRYLLCKIYLGFPCLALLTVQLRRKCCQEGQKQGWFICQSRRLFLFSNFVLSCFISPGTKEQNATSLRWGARPHLPVYREHTKTEGETSSCRGWSALVGHCAQAPSLVSCCCCVSDPFLEQTRTFNPFWLAALFPPGHLNSAGTLSHRRQCNDSSSRDYTPEGARDDVPTRCILAGESVCHLSHGCAQRSPPNQAFACLCFLGVSTR